MVTWPAIIKHSNDPELTYIPDKREWDADAELHNVEYDEADRLIDSTGNLYSLSNNENKHLEAKLNENPISLHDLLGLIKAHAAQKGSCCVAKLYAPTIADAFKIVESLEDS